MNQRGFSILEALISLSLFLGVLTGVMVAYVPTKRIYASGERRADMQQNARLAMAEMTRRIRLSGFFPENFGGAPPTPALSDPVLVATNDTLAVHGDLDGSGVTRAYQFCLDGTDLRLTSAAATSADAYDCSGGDILAQDVTTLNFTYYDNAGNPLPDPLTGTYQLDGQAAGSIPDLSDTTVRGSVRRVIIRLTLERQAPSGRDALTYTLLSDIGLRNVG